MTGKTHVYCGTAIMVYLTVLHPHTIELMDASYITAIGLASVSVGSYLPDIDIQQSKLGQKHKFLSKHLTHRGITHTLLIPALLALAMVYLKQRGIVVIPELLLGLNVGWLTHIAADLCNKKGVPLFWPLYRKRVHVFSFLTGSWQETAFTVLFTGGLLACWILL